MVWGVGFEVEVMVAMASRCVDSEWCAIDLYASSDGSSILSMSMAMSISAKMT